MSGIPRFLTTVGLLANAAGCAANGECVLHLAVSNQSLRHATASLTIRVDDATVLQENLPTATQHHYRFLDLPLRCGAHALDVAERPTNTMQSWKFELGGEMWARLLFADDARTGGFQYIVEFSNRQIGIK